MNDLTNNGDDLTTNGVKKLCELRGKDEAKLFHVMTQKKKAIKRLLDLILFSRHEGKAKSILDSDFIHCLCDVLQRGSRSQRLGVLAGSGWACTLLLVARLPDDDSYRDRVLHIVPILTDLYKSSFEDKTCIINCLAVVAYYGHNAHAKLQEAGALEIFIKAKESKSKSQSTLGAIGICYVIGHIENHPALLGQGVEFFVGLKNVTDFCLENKPYEGFQFDPCDMAGCLARLSKAKSNIPYLVNCGIIETLKTGLNCNTDLMRFMWLERNKLRIKGLVMEILWDLSFYKAGLQQIMSDPRLLQSIKRFSYGSAGKMQEKMHVCAAGILWNMQKSEHSLRRTRLKDKRGVLLSYAWQNAGRAKEIEQFLEKANFDVKFMDKSAGLNSIAESVEKSSLVIMIAGEDYKSSASCRLEAEYILSVGKPAIAVTLSQGWNPSGWLEEILQVMKSNGRVDSKPIDMSTTELFEAGQRKLFAEITKIVRSLDTMGDKSNRRGNLTTDLCISTRKKRSFDSTSVQSSGEQKAKIISVSHIRKDEHKFSVPHNPSSTEIPQSSKTQMEVDDAKSSDDGLFFTEDGDDGLFSTRGKECGKPLFECPTFFTEDVSINSWIDKMPDLPLSKSIVKNRAPTLQNLPVLSRIAKFDTNGVETWLKTTSVSPAFVKSFRKLGLDGKSVVVFNTLYKQDGVKLADFLMKKMSLNLNDVMSFLFHLDTINVEVSIVV